MQKILIITGGSRGIGRGIIEKYRQENFTIFSISRSIARDLESNYIEQISYDLTHIEGLEELIAAIFNKIAPQQTSKISLINNAGTLGEISRVENIRISDLNHSIQLNTTAPLALSALFIKYSSKYTCPKTIINISSGAAITPYYGWTAYCTSKAALDMMTRTIALEQEEVKNGVKLLSVYPGVVDTDMQTKIRGTSKEDFKNVERFIELKDTGALSDPKSVGEKIYTLDADGLFNNGAIVDIRNV